MLGFIVAIRTIHTSHLSFYVPDDVCEKMIVYIGLTESGALGDVASTLDLPFSFPKLTIASHPVKGYRVGNAMNGESLSIILNASTTKTNNESVLIL